MLRILHYDYANNKCRNEVKRIYENAFSESEKFDFDILRKCNKEPNVHLSCIIMDDIVVGMSFTVLLPNEITYLMYLAIDENYRNMHIGSEILQKYIVTSNNLILSIEYPVDTTTRKRKDFYIRNGLYDTGIQFKDTTVLYEVLTSCKDYIPTSDDLLNRYRCMTNNKIIWNRIEKSFNTKNIY